MFSLLRPRIRVYPYELLHCDITLNVHIRLHLSLTIGESAMGVYMGHRSSGVMVFKLCPRIRVYPYEPLHCNITLNVHIRYIDHR